MWDQMIVQIVVSLVSKARCNVMFLYKMDNLFIPNYSQAFFCLPAHEMWKQHLYNINKNSMWNSKTVILYSGGNSVARTKCESKLQEAVWYLWLSESPESNRERHLSSNIKWNTPNALYTFRNKQRADIMSCFIGNQNMQQRCREKICILSMKYCHL